MIILVDFIDVYEMFKEHFKYLIIKKKKTRNLNRPDKPMCYRNNNSDGKDEK
jgi:hypothetical protein